MPLHGAQLAGVVTHVGAGNWQGWLTDGVNFVPAQVWSRVMRFTGETGRRGTAFVVHVAGVDALVTAKHLCGGDADELITVQHPWTNAGAPFQVMAPRIGALNGTGDVAAFRLEPGMFAGVVGEVPLDSGGLTYTQDAFILGYPFGLSFQFADQRQELPLAKRGIVSGSLRGQDDEEIHVLDVIANPGYSGGPMVFFAPGSNAPKFAGVVKGNITAPAVEPTSAEPNPPRTTAGLSYVTNSASVLSLMN